MNLISQLYQTTERSCAGSEATSRRVISMLKGASAFYFGDEAVTPQLLREAGYATTAYITEKSRVRDGMQYADSFALPEPAKECDVLWYNGVAEFDPLSVRLEQLRECCKKGGTVVFRALCWLIDPSPDTLSYCRKRYGLMQPLDKALQEAKAAGFKVEDFCISPRSDWTKGYFAPLMQAAEQLSGERDGDVLSGMGELKKEADMFELHCEEYSYVYYILKG
ncbi:MAG: hypothetical protein E7478_07640 [Ruminococcaceae bacterium]|nr:hypothetical protein [Oscillospiraceae bacterium]